MGQKRSAPRQQLSRREVVSTSTFRRFRIVLLIAIPIAVAVAFLALFCGNIHGRPACGPLSFLAVPVTIFALVLEGLVFSYPQSGHIVRALVWLSAYVLSLPLALIALWLWQKLRN